MFEMLVGFTRPFLFVFNYFPKKSKSQLRETYPFVRVCVRAAALSSPPLSLYHCHLSVCHRHRYVVTVPSLVKRDTNIAYNTT